MTDREFDVRDMLDGAALLASTANVVMQLARPAVGYGVVESKVESGQMMRHPFRRTRNTITYLSVAFLGTAEERAFFRRRVNRSHALVRSGAGSPVGYDAFDPRLQLWVAACLYRGFLDAYQMLHGPVDDSAGDAIYRECGRLGTTLQVPEHMWPADRAAFERYWARALTELRIDPPVRDYLERLMALSFLPWPARAALGPVNRFVTAGFLPPLFRAQLQMRWTERDQRAFTFAIGMVAVVNRLLPGPVSRFPFNACLQELRLRRLIGARMASASHMAAVLRTRVADQRAAVQAACQLSGRAGARGAGARRAAAQRQRAPSDPGAGGRGIGASFSCWSMSTQMASSSTLQA